MTIALDKIKRLVAKGNYRYSQHAVFQMIEREIDRKEIEEVILNGEIIERYETERRDPCCLVFGKTLLGRPLHVVCTKSPNMVIVTVYEPDPKIWIGFKTRRIE